MPRPRDLAALGGHGDLETVGNPSGLLQEDGRCGEQTSVVVCSNNDSPVEVLRLDRQRKIGLHRLTVVAAGHQDSPHDGCGFTFCSPRYRHLRKDRRGMIAEPHHLSIATDQLRSEFVRRKHERTNSLCAQAEGRCWREAHIRETPTSVKCQNATSPEQRTSAAKDEGATRG